MLFGACLVTALALSPVASALAARRPLRESSLCGLSPRRAKKLHRRSRCVVIAEDPEIRVFYTLATFGSGKLRFSERERTFARLKGSSLVVSLGETADDIDTVHHIALAGAFVGVDVIQFVGGSNQGGEGEVMRLEMRDGKAKETGITSCECGVSDLVVSAAGAMAWIPRTSPTRSVIGLPPGSSKPVTLAQSVPVNPSSLAFAGGLLYWSEGETPREAIL